MKEKVKVTRNQYATLSTYLNEILDDYGLDGKDRSNIIHRFKTHMKLCENDENVEEMQKQENLPILKPFNLKDAKAGKPVCTRDGRKVRFLCFDLKSSIFPIIAAVSSKENNEDIEIVTPYTREGRYNSNNEIEDDIDLMMLPETKEGWINIYQYATDPEYCVYGPIYETKKEAEENCVDNYLTTTKITWEV